MSKFLYFKQTDKLQVNDEVKLAIALLYLALNSIIIQGSGPFQNLEVQRANFVAIMKMIKKI